MTQYRLLQSGVDTIEKTDEFYNATMRMWITVPPHFDGDKLLSDLPYRRAIPEPEMVEQESTIDPGEGYRLVQDDEIVLPTDERIFANLKGCSWDICIQHTKLSEVILLGTMTYKQLKEFSEAWAFLVFRRRTAKKIVLKEYVERYGTSTRIEWRSESDEGFRHAGFIMPDESWPTGQEREIEIPA